MAKTAKNCYAFEKNAVESSLARVGSCCGTAFNHGRIGLFPRQPAGTKGGAHWEICERWSTVGPLATVVSNVIRYAEVEIVEV